MRTKVFSFVSERQVIRFGSTVNGLAMVGSDVDCVALLNVTAAAETVVEQATEVFRQYPHIFKNFYTFPGSVDFISFQHIPTGILIDLIMNDMNWVRNTELIKHLIHVDERVFNLVIIIKHWAIVHKLTRERVLSNYSVSLLVIFYLQQRNFLPSIASLQKDAEPYFIEGWNSGFNNIEYESRIDVSFYHLLGGFFEYYNAFNFDKYIISTYTGRAIKRKLFKNLQNVPAEYDLYKRNVGLDITRPLILRQTPVLIQDPFTHFENLARHLTPRPLAQFKACFKYAALKYRENNESLFLHDILSDT